MFRKGRKFTSKGEMSSSGNGPAIQMMPPHIRAMFMPDPPLKHLPPAKRRRAAQYKDPPALSKEDAEKKGETKKEGEEKGGDDGAAKAKDGADAGASEEKKDADSAAENGSDRDREEDGYDPLRPSLKTSVTGLAHLMDQFERTPPPERVVGPTPKSVKSSRARRRSVKSKERLAPVIETYRDAQKDAAGEWRGMNCYNTLFVGRLAYEVTERKLLREFEAFGPVKDLKLVTSRDPETGERKSKGYAFVEYEHEEDMKRAYHRADGMRVEGREVVVDVERGHTVPNWLPRRLGGGLGGTRLGGKDKNVTRPGRYDPSKPDAHRPPMGGGGPGGPGPMGGHMGGGPGGPMGGGPPMGGGRGPPPPGYGGPPGPGYGGDRYGGPPPGRGGPPGPGGDYYGGGRGGGPPPPGYGGGYDRRGPPPGPGGGYGGGPPGGPPGYGGPPHGRGGPPGPGGDYYGGGRGGPPPGAGVGYGGGRKRGRSRSRSPERRRGRF